MYVGSHVSSISGCGYERVVMRLPYKRCAGVNASPSFMSDEG